MEATEVKQVAVFKTDLEIIIEGKKLKTNTAVYKNAYEKLVTDYQGFDCGFQEALALGKNNAILRNERGQIRAFPKKDLYILPAKLPFVTIKNLSNVFDQEPLETEIVLDPKQYNKIEEGKFYEVTETCLLSLIEDDVVAGNIIQIVKKHGFDEDILEMNNEKPYTGLFAVLDI